MSCFERAHRSSEIVYVGFLTGHGGDALQMLGLAHGVSRLGARVRIVVPRGEHSVTFQERSHALGIECERSPLITADVSGPRQSFRAMVALVRSVDAGLVHFHSGNSCLPRSLMLALERARFSSTFVTLQSPFETFSPRSARARFWAATASRRCLAVASPSEHGTRFQLHCGVPASVAVTIRNSIDLERMAHGSAARARASLGVDGDVPIVLFSSRIDKQKRPVEAVRIFANVAEEFSDAIMAFIGAGELESAVRAEADRLGLDRRVRLMGYQTDVSDWLAAATVWLLPTERENFSVAVLEAMAAGCAVLSTSCPGNDEVLMNGHNALTVPVGAIDDASAALRRLLGDPALRSRLGATAQLDAKEFSTDSMVDRYRELYLRHPRAPRCLELPD